MDSGRSWAEPPAAIEPSATVASSDATSALLKVRKRDLLFNGRHRPLGRAAAEQIKPAEHEQNDDEQRDDKTGHTATFGRSTLGQYGYRRFCVSTRRLYSAAMRQSHSPPVPNALARPIVLVGLMGVGKSTVGRRLANRLKLPFADADHEIEAAAGMTVTEIFDRFGEPYFRDGERRVIARLMDGKPKVIATGGGAFVNESTRALILDQATAVWLHADTSVLAERVQRRDTRPLLRGRDPKAVLAELAAKRDPIYAKAHIHVPSHKGPHETTVAAILNALKEAA